MKNLTILESLRPWASAGITSFLADPELAASFVFDDCDTEIGQAPDAGRYAPSDGSIAQRGNAVSPANTLSSGSAVFSGHPQANTRDSGRQRTSLTPQSTPASSEDKTYSDSNRPQKAESIKAVWTAEWKARYAKTVKAPVLWTYKELGLDLSGKGSADRSHVLKEIIGALHLPKGSSMFWPYSLPSDDVVCTANIPVFHEGLEFFSPHVVILIGQSSLECLPDSIPLSVPFTHHIVKGRLYMLLPEFEVIQKSSSAVIRIATFLRSSLSGLGIFKEV